MTFDLESTLDRIGEKSRFLTERFKVVSRQRDEALATIAELQKQVRDREKQLQLMKAELEYLKVSSTIAPTAETVTATRVMIRELISEIDKCISDLKE